MHITPDIKEIQRIVGPVTQEQIRFIDCFVFEDIGIFLPVAGPCYYALSPEHTHPSHMIIYSFNGEPEGWINGVGKSELRAGDFMYMPNDIKHQENEGSEIPKYLAVMIMPELFKDILTEYELPDNKKDLDITIAKANKLFLPLCWQFIAEYNSTGGGRKSLLRALSTQICHAVVSSICDSLAQSTPLQWPVEIGKCITYIHSNLHEKLSLTDIAGIANMSVPNFSRAFKREMGQSPMDYVLSQRLHKAHNMLMSNEFSMNDIAIACGYSSISHFSTSFKKRYLSSPEKYRQKFEFTDIA